MGQDHPEVATGLKNLARLLHDQGQYTAAESLFRRAIALLEKTLGPEHPNTKTVRENLVLLLEQMKSENLSV